MFLLTLISGDREIILGSFQVFENGRSFLEKVPSYAIRFHGDFECEQIDFKDFPDYIEIDYNGHLIPMSKFMFNNDSIVDVFWQDIPNFDSLGNGLIDGSTIVDAYSVVNSDLHSYIKRREDNFIFLTRIFSDKGYELSRNFAASQDGEGIMYRKKGSEKWCFLIHMDPDFVDNFNLDSILELIN